MSKKILNFIESTMTDFYFLFAEIFAHNDDYFEDTKRIA